MERLSTHHTGLFDEGAAEIAAYDPASQRLFVVNAQAATLDVLDLSEPAAPVLADSLDMTPYGAVANSVAVRGGLVAVAIESEPKTDPGRVVFLDVQGELLGRVKVGALPDMLTFTPDGTRVLVANEGEPSDDYTTDPEGSISVIDLADGVGALDRSDVTTIGFGDFDAGGPRAAEVTPGIRIYGPDATVAQDLEPEYIAVSPDGTTAWVTLQENNALAILDLIDVRVDRLVSLGTKDHGVAGQGLDPSDEDGGIDIRTAPVRGLYQPDAVVAFEAEGETYLLLANEGDARDYDTYSEEARVGDAGYELAPEAFPDAVELLREENLGRLTVSTASGDRDGDGTYEEIHVFGGRSFSVRRADGELVFDSGDAFERITAERYPEHFNASNDENGPDALDDRSDAKGPEPEGATVGVIDGVPYAFIGLERVGGVMIFEVSDPATPRFVNYVNHRDFAADATTTEAGDLGPEGLVFVSAADAPRGRPLLVVSNEVSGTTTVFEVVAANSEE